MKKKQSSHEPVVIEWSPGMRIEMDVADVGRDVIIALSRKASFLRAVRVPNASNAEVAQILQMQLGQLLPIEASAAAFDFRLTDDVNAEGRLAVMCAVKSVILKQIKAELKVYEPRSVRVVPAAFGSWLLAKSLDLTDCAVIESNRHGLSIDIITGGELRYSRQTQNVEADQIEVEIARTLSAAGIEPPVIVAAGGLALPGAQFNTAETSAEQFALPAASRLDIALESPEELAERHAIKLKRRMRLAVASLSLGLVLSMFAFFERADARTAQAAEDAKSEAALASLRDLLQVQEKRADENEKLIATLDRAFDPAQTVSDVVLVVSSYVPDGLWLTGINLDRGRPLQIRGTSTSSEAISALIEGLSTDPRFRDVTLSFANNASIDDIQVVNFAITAHVVGNIPLIDRRARR